MPSVGFWLLPSILGTALALAVAAVAGIRRPGTGWRYMVALGVAVAWWCFGQSLWLFADSQSSAIHVNQFQYVGITLAPLLWFWLALKQSGRTRWLRWRYAGWFLVVPVATMIIAFGYEPGGNNILWREFSVPPDVLVAKTRYGPWFWVMLSHNYLVFFAGCAVLWEHYRQSPYYRVQLYVTSVIPLILVAMNALFIAGKWPLPTDPSPIGFALGFALLGWAMLRHKLLDLSPIGRDMVFDSLGEGALILDQRQRIVDINAAACRMIRCEIDTALGRAAMELLPHLDLAWQGIEPQELRLSTGGVDRIRVHVDTAPIDDGAGIHLGTVVTLRDVTRERLAQEALLETQQRLRDANSELERMAHVDALTGLANRRMLLSRIEQEIARARRHGAHLALLMIDLDHFKLINDTHGHIAGDRVLESSGSLLRRLTRPADIAARYGGEEFALLLTDTDAAGARTAAARVWDALRSLHHIDPDVGELHVSSSVGLAMLRDADRVAGDLIARADAALYRAKAAGRDCVIAAEDAGFSRLTETA